MPQSSTKLNKVTTLWPKNEEKINQEDEKVDFLYSSLKGFRSDTFFTFMVETDIINSRRGIHIQRGKSTTAKD